MRFGVGAVNSLLVSDLLAMRDVAQAAEDLGLDFLTLIDHVVLAHPGADGTRRSLYEPETPYHDILVAAGFLAGITSTIALRTAVVILPQRGPAVVAKQAAAVDAFSGGRLELGLGIGWHAEEYEALGVPFRERGRRFDEGLELMKQLWDRDRVDFAGRFYRVDGMRMEPKPATRPHPPLWFGGTVPATFRRVARDGVGWLSRPVQTLDQIADSWRQILALTQDAGRDPSAVRMHVSVPLGPALAADEIVRTAQRFAEIGATDFSFFTSYMAGLETAADHIAQYRRAVEEIIPAIQAGP